MPDAPNQDTLERLGQFRSLMSNPNRQTGQAELDVVAAAQQVVERVGPEQVSVVWFDGTIVLVRRWPSYLRSPSGRDVEIYPDGTMTLVTDYQYEPSPEVTPALPLCIEDAAAWLAADTRSRDRAEQALELVGNLGSQEYYRQGYLDALKDAEAAVSRLVPKPGAYLEHGIAAIRHLRSQLPDA